MKPTRYLNSLIRLLCVSLTVASYVAGAGLEDLSARASLVVAGTVSNRSEGPTGVHFTITVAKFLKGDGVPRSTIDVSHHWSGLLSRDEAISQALSGIWFLTKAGDSTWDVLTARPSGVRTILGLFLPYSEGAAMGVYGYQEASPLTDKLALEVAAAINISHEDPDILVGALGFSDTPAIRLLLRTYADSNDPSLRATGIAGLLGRNDPDSMAYLEHNVASLSKLPQLTIVTDALAAGWRDTSLAGIERLINIANAKEASGSVRLAAIRAAAALHTQQTLPFLASLLQSNDPEEQERAIYGISAFANGCPVQNNDNSTSLAFLICDGPAPYRTPEVVKHFAFRRGSAAQQSELVSFWQDWWNAYKPI